MFGGLRWRFTLLSVALLYGIGVAVVYACRGSTHGSTSAEISTEKFNACSPASGHAAPFPSANAPSSPLRAARTQADTPSQAAACSPQQLSVSLSSSSSSSSSLSLIQVLFPAATPLLPHLLSVIVSHLQVVRCLCSDGMLLAITLLAMTNKYCCWLICMHFFMIICHTSQILLHIRGAHGPSNAAAVPPRACAVRRHTRATTNSMLPLTPI
jgi:hypothetical protein